MTLLEELNSLHKSLLKPVSVGRSIKNYASYLANSHKSSVLGCGFWGNMGDGAYRGGVAFDDTGLKAYYKLNETATDDIVNQSESAVDLGVPADLQTNGVTYGATGKIGDAVSWDGIDDDAIAGTSKSQFNFFQEGKSTICFWMKYLFTPPSTAGIFSTSEQGEQAGLFINTSPNHPLLFTLTNPTPAVLAIVTTADDYIPDLTNYYFYVIKADVDLTTDTVIVRRNDGNEVKANRTNAPAAGDAHRAMLWGKRQTTAPTRPSNMVLDEVSMFSKILSASDETDLFNSDAGLEIY